MRDDVRVNQAVSTDIRLAGTAWNCWIILDVGVYIDIELLILRMRMKEVVRYSKIRAFHLAPGITFSLV